MGNTDVRSEIVVEEARAGFPRTVTSRRENRFTTRKSLRRFFSVRVSSRLETIYTDGTALHNLYLSTEGDTILRRRVNVRVATHGDDVSNTPSSSCGHRQYTRKHLVGDKYQKVITGYATSADVAYR